ncbi:MAG: exodeoxyribonuclease VII small subunit [Lachnospiraceae bacterium]|nr:exodeoxyribonuclease VII small subunit [Lachnospiraceae bacterium]
MSEEKKLTIEEAFAKLDDTIKEMESEDVTLERSFALYKSGMEMIENCTKEIDLVEKKVLELSGNGETHEF